LTGALGANAYVARFAGEQFCAFVHDESSDSLTRLFERAGAGIERANFSYQNERLNVSVGAALCEADDSLDADEVLSEAEDAGGNRVVIKT
jgi:GGDEF domain-containing protein